MYVAATQQITCTYSIHIPIHCRPIRDGRRNEGMPSSCLCRSHLVFSSVFPICQSRSYIRKVGGRIRGGGGRGQHARIPRRNMYVSKRGEETPLQRSGFMRALDAQVRQVFPLITQGRSRKRQKLFSAIKEVKKIQRGNGREGEGKFMRGWVGGGPIRGPLPHWKRFTNILNTIFFA